MAKIVYNTRKIELLGRVAAIMDLMSSLIMLASGLYITVTFDWFLSWPGRILVGIVALGYAFATLRHSPGIKTLGLLFVKLKPLVSRSCVVERDQISS